jgi:hypothetical protein
LPGQLHFAGKTGFHAACPAAQTPLYVRPPPVGPHLGSVAARRQRNLKALICRVYLFSSPKRSGAAAAGSVVTRNRFCSLRLSVRTPPFHGGESGSIPLGSANAFRCEADRESEIASPAGRPAGAQDSPVLRSGTIHNRRDWTRLYLAASSAGNTRMGTSPLPSGVLIRAASARPRAGAVLMRVPDL